MTDVFALIAQRRRDLADEFASFTAEQLLTASLCENWSVRDVGAHLLMPLEVSLPGFVVKMLRSGFDFNRAADRFARSDQRTGTQIAGVLRSRAEHRFTPPGFGAAAPLTDTFVHGQDIHRPLGLTHTLDEEQARTILGLLVTPKAAKAFGGKGLIDGLRVEATDADFRHGDGPVVSAPAEALILTLAGRRAALGELTGDGAAALRRRAAAS